MQRHHVYERQSSFNDIAKLTLYVVDWTGDKTEALGRRRGERGRAAWSQSGAAHNAIGVASLGEPDLLVEVEAIAVLT